MEKGESIRQGFRGGNEVFKLDLRRGILTGEQDFRKECRGGYEDSNLVIRHWIKLGG